jgi:hypothetical protein
MFFLIFIRYRHLLFVNLLKKYINLNFPVYNKNLSKVFITFMCHNWYKCY